MTVSSATNEATFPGNGATQIFPLPFRFFEDSDIVAQLIDDATGVINPLTLGVHYTLSGAADPEVDGAATGILTMLAAPVVGKTLFVLRELPVTQPTDIVNQGRFFPEIHENVFDRLTMLIQQGIGGLGKALRVGSNEPGPAFLPPIATRANQLLSFDSNGNPISVAPASGSAAELALDLANSADLAKGAAMIGWRGHTVNEFLDALILLEADSTGTTSANTIIQDALSANDVVVLPAGDFKLSATLQFKTGNALIGQGHGSTRIFRDTAVAAFDFIDGKSVTDVAVRGIFFDSVAKLPVTDAANRHCAIRFWDNGTAIRSERIDVSGCRFEKFTAAELQPEGNRGVVSIDKCNEVQVYNNRFEDNRSTCVFYYDSADIQVFDNFCIGEQLPYDLEFQPTQGLGSFASGNSEGVSIANNRIRDTGFTSINVGGSGVSVTGNVVRNPSYSCITVQEGAVTSTDVVIAGNSLHGADLANISLFNVDRFVVSGNTISGNTSSTNGGIRCFVSSGGLFPKNGVISGNLLSGNAGPGVRVNGGQGIEVKGNLLGGNTVGVFVDASGGQTIDVRVTGNTIQDNTNYGVETSNAATAQSVFLADNAFISSDIATLQATGVVVNGANSTVNFGRNTFSSNYVTNRVETSFGSRATKAVLQLNSGILSSMKLLDGLNYIATATYDPPSLVDGAGTITTVSVPGAALGDFATATFSLDTAGLIVTAWVSAANTVSVRFQNETSVTVDLGSGTLTARVIKL